MDDELLRRLIDGVASGEVKPDDALSTLRRLPFADLGFARVDHHRILRQGFPEAIYGPGKTPQQCARLVDEFATSGAGPILLTRATRPQIEAASAVVPAPEVTETHSGTDGEPLHLAAWRPASPRGGRPLVVTAGTADLGVAAECCATLRAYGFAPGLLVDCGVAGVHRLLASYDELAAADVVVVVAGMEGALASVVGGLTPAPLIAVPTSVGYGAGLEGVTALLAMHASCASGVTVVGIDNGFGAASAVARILGPA